MFRPLADKIIVKRAAVEGVSAGGIIEKPERGTVVAVGRGRRMDNGTMVEPSVRPVDVVYFSRYSGTEVDVDGEKRMIVGEGEILGVFE